MTRQEETFERDYTFHFARRKFGYDIPATDIDFLEYDNFKPVLLWEAKSNRSRWKNGNRTASMVVQFRLARLAGIEYRVVEHNPDWSKIRVVEIQDWHRNEGPWYPTIKSEVLMTLPEFVAWLYKIRGRSAILEHPPTSLEQVVLRVCETTIESERVDES